MFCLLSGVVYLINDVRDLTPVEAAPAAHAMEVTEQGITVPVLATLGILTFLSSWNGFIYPLIMATSPEMYTLPVALARFSGQLVVPFHLVLAMSVLSIVPVVLIFLLLQRQIIAGIAQSIALALFGFLPEFLQDWVGGLVANSLKDQGVDTALLMSDVVYPAGDVNQWADAVYLPYFGLPRTLPW